eukprot:TRINITY_DN687_c0_g1_i1.p1 TRINITY_DN687_c0_g1~~TRINITY_DN687_c0_g1_i1.p1  ORF type:complete len:497 (-),score=48.70 TRINITY_DN687_c0_g1_i1:54-1544(-)
MQDIETRTMRMNLQSMTRIGFIITFALFIILFLASVMIGAFLGPSVFYHFPRQTIPHANLERNNTLPVSGLTKLNQQLILDLQVGFIGSFDSELDVVFLMSVFGRNSNSSKWKTLQENRSYNRKLTCRKATGSCDSVWLAHLPFLGYSDYNFTISLINGTKNNNIGNIEIQITVAHHSFTLFELWFRFIFLVMTFVVILWYSHKLRMFKWKDWTIEQKWVSVLLFGLLGYNNPIFPLGILVNGWFLVLLDQILLVSFLVLILFFWLVMFDGLWKEPKNITFLSFYLPKIVLLGFFWVMALVAFTWTQLHQLDDVGTRLYEITGYVFFQIFTLLALIIYVFWLVYASCRAIGNSKTMPYLGLRLKFFGLFTMFVMLLTAGGIIFGFIGPISNNAAEFLSFLSLFNLYLYTLAFVYLPSKSAYTGRKLDIGSIRLEDEDPDHNAFEREEDNSMVKIEFEKQDDDEIEMQNIKRDEDESSSESDENKKKKIEPRVDLDD